MTKFKDKQKLQHMLILHDGGASVNLLSKKFKASKATIYKQIKAHKPEPFANQNPIRCRGCDILLLSKYAGEVVNGKCEECNKNI